MRLFVAVWPPADVVRQLHAFPRPALPRVRYTTEAQWHVTLAFLGEVDDVDAATAAVTAAAAASTGPVRATAGPVAERLGRQVLCVPVHGLDEVAAAVGRETAAWSRPDGGRPFKGHLTLARAVGRSVVPPGAAGAPFAATWSVDTIALVASELSRDGARYRDVLVAPLTPG